MKFSLCISVLLCASLGMAQTSAKPKSTSRKTPAPAVTAEEVNALRSALAAQQQKVEEQSQQLQRVTMQLQQLLDASQKAQSNAEQAQATATQAGQSAADAQKSAEQASSAAAQTNAALAMVSTKEQEEGKKISLLETLTGRLRFTGDVRVRGEDFFQDCPQCVTRNRARLRLRFGVEGKVGEDFTGGLLLTSGSLGDSNSTNESLTNFFTRKTIGIDRAYINYQPMAHKWLSLTGGKFAFTWQRTSMTFDPDLNPEGFSEKFSFDLKTPVVKNFTIQGIQLLYSEVTKGDDSFAVGGQVSGKLNFGPVSTTPSFTVLDWRWPDALLTASGFAVQSPGEGPGCAGGTGFPTTAPCVYGPQGFTNATFTGTDGKLHFLSGFTNADLIINNTIQTPWKRFPVNVLLEYENNLNAADHPLDTDGNPLPDLGKQSHAYQFDVSLGPSFLPGQTTKKGDVQFGYAFWRQEQDSALASFTESETRAPTNILQHKIYVFWKLRPNVVASYNLWIGRTLNSNLQHAILATGIAPGATEPYLKRMQFDLIYSF